MNYIEGMGISDQRQGVGCREYGVVLGGWGSPSGELWAAREPRERSPGGRGKGAERKDAEDKFHLL